MLSIHSIVFFFLISFSLTLGAGETRVVHVPGIGNSFTVNSMKFLPDIVASDPEIKGEIAGAILGGCPLDKHVRLANEHVADSSKGNDHTYKLNGQNLKTDISLKEILQDQEWDVVAIQQVSTKSYKLGTYTPYAGEMIKYIRKIKTIFPGWKTV